MRRGAALVLALALPLGACSGEDPSAEPAPTVSTESTEATEATAPTDSAPTDEAAELSPGPTQPPTPAEQDERLPPTTDTPSLANLMREQIDAGRIRRTARLGGTDRWTSWAVTYTVDGATVSGELLVPTGRGPFPALVLNHGHIDPGYYTLGLGMSREQEWFAANGFVVLHTDYRGHAASDPVSDLGRETRLVYTRDAIGAVEALEQERYVDDERLGMVGRSMGGGVTYNAIVAQPDLVDAAVVFAPVSSDYLDNLRRWTIPERPDAAQALYDDLGGSPRANPGAYRALSARTYFDRIEVPVLIHHGTSDDSCPIAWSRESQRLLTRAGVDSTLAVYEGEEHAFGPQFPASMRRTVEFLRARLGA
ncbi:prolyl oligopeptidase family serine peptidase [Nocardioides sp. YIM 152315]|uniref:alpha/beta hydrolase family protein n=1 Tax=Nocardioides sp. YIM 152315 TaxID=3031760 RepID=UPI0023D9B275|nr:prolyl oligopeptidase family serine peptidase [Nocardioides sp. YIM 152315]MDF1604865.1 prolyl oligopeptidase family serine peptidase [Nocardioides sp. YIM 152315]